MDNKNKNIGQMGIGFSVGKSIDGRVDLLSRTKNMGEIR